MARNTIQRSGSFVVDADYERVFETLTNPETIVRCLPDEVEAVETHSDGSVKANVTVGVSAIQSRLNMHLDVEEADTDTGHIMYTGRGTGSRSEVMVTGRFTLESVDDGVKVEWIGDVEFSGLFASLGLNVGRLDYIAAEKIDLATSNVKAVL